MKRYNFATFFVNDENREGLEVCRAIADGQPVNRQPVLLLGEQGSGKTHLLYSIVNSVQAGTPRTGLAYVTATGFPDQVRALIHDPSPVQNKDSAILLVDQIERFRDLTEELEAVVRIFLDAGHSVILASRLHPERLQNLTAGLRQLLREGRIVRIAAQGPEAHLEQVRQEVRAECEGRIRVQQEEILRLRRLADEAGQRAAGPDAARLTQELQAERVAKDRVLSEKAELERKLSVAKAFSDSVQRELAALQEERRQIRAGIQSEFQQEIDQALSDKAALQSRVSELQRQLEAARTEGERARSDANDLLQRAESLLRQIEANRAAFAEKEAEQRNRIRELEKLISEKDIAAAAAEELALAEVRIEGLQAQIETLRTESDQQRAQLEERLVESARAVDAEKASFNMERDALLAQLARLGSERDALQQRIDETGPAIAENESARRQLEQQLGAVRGTLAGVERETENTRKRLAQIESTLSRMRSQRDAARARIKTLGERFAASAHLLADLAAFLGTSPESESEPIGHRDPPGRPAPAEPLPSGSATPPELEFGLDGMEPQEDESVPSSEELAVKAAPHQRQERPAQAGSGNARKSQPATADWPGIAELAAELGTETSPGDEEADGPAGPGAAPSKTLSGEDLVEDSEMTGERGADSEESAPSQGDEEDAPEPRRDGEQGDPSI